MNIVDNFNKCNNIITIYINEKLNTLLNKLQHEYFQKYNNYFIFEGNYGTFNFNSENLNLLGKYKVANLLWAIKLLCDNDNLNICEIGFNAGHSACMITSVLEDKSFNFYIFDYGEHYYMKPCFDLLYSSFKKDNNNILLIEGDSIITLPNFINNNQQLIGNFNFIHIDGGHTKECIENDFKNADLLIKKDGIIIIDDTNISVINECVDYYINNKNYEELIFYNLNEYCYPHRIIIKK
jgi:hypothetical protein